MKVIAFGHRQRVGKDTAVRLLLSKIKFEHPGIDAIRLGLFDWAKEACCEMFSYAGMGDRIYYENHPELRDTILPSIGKTPRQIWLEFGYYLREIHGGCIPENALKTADADIILVSDIRSVQDVTYVRKFDGLMIRIDRDVPRLESQLKGHPAYSLDCSLETFNDWDDIIDNNGTLAEFGRQLDRVLTRIL